MKKKRIDLGKKLTLGKSTIVALDAGNQQALAGGQTGTVCFSAATTPCGVCVQSQGCGGIPQTQPPALCNFATLNAPGGCQPSGNVACYSVQANGCGSAGNCVISNVGGGCQSNVPTLCSGGC